MRIFENWLAYQSLTTRFHNLERALFFQCIDLKYLCCISFGTENGSYAYIETSWPRKPNDTARLLSPIVPVSTRPGNCLKFWYHMYGPHIETLNVYTMTSNKQRTLRWTRSGNQGTEWKYGQVFMMNPTPIQVGNIQKDVQRYKTFISMSIIITIIILFRRRRRRRSHRRHHHHDTLSPPSSSPSNFVIIIITFISIIIVFNHHRHHHYHRVSSSLPPLSSSP